ncbi:MAG: hypothetical protein N3E47_05050, partial [Candidatus Bathyarchaeota archaeon]|nr:hypothetical protein [Candidatus Bathyarchaeota archaeon]
HYQGQDVKQEEIFYADINGVREEIGKMMEKMLRGTRLIKNLPLGIITEPIETELEGRKYRFERWVSINKINENEYEICYPLDMNVIFSLREVLAKVPFLKKMQIINSIMKRDLGEVCLLNENRFIDGLKKFTFKEMGLTESDYEIRRENIEISL